VATALVRIKKSSFGIHLPHMKMRYPSSVRSEGSHHKREGKVMRDRFGSVRTFSSCVNSPHMILKYPFTRQVGVSPGMTHPKGG